MTGVESARSARASWDEGAAPVSQLAALPRKSVARVFKLLSVWTETDPQVKLLKRQVTCSRISSGSTESLSIDGVPRRRLELMCCLRKAVHPHATVRILWDILSMVLVMYECVMIPLQLLDLPEIPTLGAMVWVTRCFWTMDLPLAFITGYLSSEGVVQLRPWLVARNYLLSWFPLDFMLVCLDWGELFVGDATGTNAARMGKTFKTVRMVRMMRFFRLVQMNSLPAFVRSFIDAIRSELAIILSGLVKMMVMLIWIHHVLACVWFYIAESNSDADNWLTVYEVKGDFTYRYFTAFHWSQTQFAGSMEVFPTNVGERCFAVITLLAAFIISAWVVSSLTTSMTRLEIATGEDSKKLEELNAFLINNKITPHLKLRVKRNLKHVFMEEKRERPNLELLKLLSEPLRVELHFEVHMRVMGVHPFMRLYASAFLPTMQQVCHRAIARLHHTRGDVLFRDGEIPQKPKLYFVTSGSFSYAQSGDDGQPVTEAVHPEEWVSEGALWTAWEHLGQFSASSTSIVYTLDCLVFQNIVSQAKGCDVSARNYGEEFVRNLNRLGASVTDLRGFGIDLETMAHTAIPEELLPNTFEVHFLGSHRGSRILRKRVSMA